MRFSFFSGADKPQYWYKCRRGQTESTAAIRSVTETNLLTDSVDEGPWRAFSLFLSLSLARALLVSPDGAPYNVLPWGVTSTAITKQAEDP